MNSKPFRMPFPNEYKDLEDALWKYYLLCFPHLDDDERYDLTRGALVDVEQTVKRLYKVKG